MRVVDVCALCLVLLIAFGGLPRPAVAADTEPAADIACPGLMPGPVRSVTRIVDGETLALDDGSELRLIGALAPRAMDVGAEPGTWAPEAAMRSELQSLALGKSVELHFGGDRQDRYGRWQAQALLVDGDQRRWLQGHLLLLGLARAYTIAGNRACSGELLAAERVARESRRGLWVEGAYQVRRTEQVRELLPYRATFQVVEGRIARVAFVRGVIHLNFGRDWRHAFSVSVQTAERSVLGAYARDPKGLEGSLARVAGWIETRRGGPTIDLSVAGIIEFTSDPSGRSIEKRP